MIVKCEHEQEHEHEKDGDRENTMKVCPQCGFRHLDEDERCLKCGALLDIRPDRLRAGQRTLMPGWPGRVAAAVRRRLYFIGKRLHSELPEGVHYRSPWAAGALSLVPGLGQIYNHQPKKALIILLWIAACVGAAAATFYHPASNWILLASLGAWVYGFHDALITAKRINRDYFIWQHAIGFYCAWFFYICFSCFMFQWATCYFVLRFYTIGYDVLNPYLCLGERVVVDMITEPRVGDVVLYNPPKMEVEFPDEIESFHLTLDPYRMIERIVAGPGQTIERRGGIFYRDGRELSLNEEPLLSDQIPLDLKLTAPPDKYIILYTHTFGKDWMTNADVTYLRLNKPGMIVHGGAEVCAIGRKQIIGRVLCVYNPPPRRRWLK